MDRKLKDKIWTSILYLISCAVVLLLVALVLYILNNGKHFLDFDFIFGKPKYGEEGGGVGPQLFNSFYMLIITLVISVPIGIGAGVYLSQYSKEGPFVRILRLSIETIASLPSIVVGLFGFLIFVNLSGWGFTLLGGALALTLLNLPALARVSENAITEAALDVKESSMALGGTKWQTIWKMIIPTAFPGILTGIIITAGRIFGEAAALLYTSGMSSNNKGLLNVMRPAETLAVHIFKLNSEGTVPDAASIASGAAALLVVMVFIFNMSARLLGRRMMKHR